MNVLFVCEGNRQRSPTAQEIFADVEGVNTDSAGVRADAEKIVSRDQVEWADLIVTMERREAVWIRERFSRALGETKLVTLDIPDRYAFMDRELIEILEERAAPHLQREAN